MPTDIQDAAPPSLWRRLAAMFYDAWLILAMWLLGVTVDFFIRKALGINPDGSHPLLQAYLVICPFVFFGWFWTHGGQTLGMRAWRLKLLGVDGSEVGWRQSIVRVAGAHVSLFALGLGYLWILLDKRRMAWHDHLSRTRLVIVTEE